MKARSDEFLNFLLWSATLLTQPSFRNLTDSYESWAYRNGLLRQAGALEKLRLVERDPQDCDQRLYRLTEQGRLRALGGRDPEMQWSRSWDGHWRLVVFDVPISRNAHREKLRRYLRNQGFGRLQNSIWITPDPLRDECDILKGTKGNVGALTLFEARPCGGESDEEIVAGAWNFDRINRRYMRHLRILDQHPDGPLQDEASARALQRWASAERQAWLAAILIDPLLPQTLLPPDYLGRKSWHRRTAVFRRAGQQLRTFQNRVRT
jgi:phenylacetic acid degradation operon negative regulatory protein